MELRALTTRPGRHQPTAGSSLETQSLTVAILTRERRPLVARCIESIQRTARAAGVPIVVLVNGSTDDTAAFLRSSYPDIEVHEEPTNLGCPGGRNRLTELCGTVWVAYLDDDGTVDDHYIDAALVAISEAPDDRAVIAGNIIDVDLDPNPVRSSGPTGSFSGGICIVRRADFLRLGGYPEDGLRQGEETEFAMKAYDDGRTIDRSASLVLYHPLPRSRAKQLELLRTGLRQSLITGVRLCPWWLVPGWTVWKIAIYLQRALRLRGLRAFAGALRDAAVCLPVAIRTRQPVRARAVMAASGRFQRSRV